MKRNVLHIAAILIALAAKKSVKEGRPVKIAEILG